MHGLSLWQTFQKVLGIMGSTRGRLEIVFNYQVMHLRFTLLRPTLHEESRPMFNSNRAFLLVQKLKSAPRALH
jgi:hypothetical protein